jgi:hypothetical protein
MSDINEDQDIIEKFYNLCVELKREPSFEDLETKGVLRKDVRRLFTNKTKLKNIVYEKYNINFDEVETQDLEQTSTDTFTEQKKKYIKDLYLEVLKTNKRFPYYSDFTNYGVSSSNISTLFGGIEKLKASIMEEYKDEIKNNFSILDDLFSEDRGVKDISYPQRYIITTAVGDCNAHTGFLNALDTFCQRNDAKIVIMPCESVTNSFENETAIFDSVFNDTKYMFVTQDTRLNKNLQLCSIQVSAKQIKSTTGLSRLGTRHGSYIFAGPKQFLDYKPSGHVKGKNYSIMTTGACTQKSYFDNRYVSKRLSYIAEHDHIIGAVIVEIVDDTHFHFRQIQADEDGNFIDLGVEYRHDGSIIENIPMTIVLGDIHADSADEDAIDTFIESFKKFKIKNIFLHDIFDGNSVNHHISTIAEKTKRENKGKSSLKDELVETFNLINYIKSSLSPDNVYIVKSNHDEFLTRYLSEGRYISDPINHYLSLKIATALFENEDVLKRAFTEVGVTSNDMENIHFLDRKTSFTIAGIQLAAHGDLGINGAKPSLNGLEEAYGNCVIGHNHSAAIQRGVFRVGTMSKLDMDYNRGPSSWTQTNCIVYDNGQRQLVNFVNNAYYLE